MAKPPKDGVAQALEKFAISGGMHARALGNAAQRSGARLAPQVTRAIAAQPRAALTPATRGLSNYVREGGGVRPSMAGDLPGHMAKLPFVNSEHLHAAGQSMAQQAPGVRAFNDMLSTTGRVHAGTGATNAAIERSFGPAEGYPVTALKPKAAPITTTQQTVVQRRKAANAAPWAIGAGLPLLTAGGIFASKPAIRSNIKNLVESKGTLQENDQNAALPVQATDTASLIHKHLQERGIDPASLRIAVDAAPGTGKTTLSRAMAQQLGVKHYGLDWLPNNKLHSMMGGGHLDKMPRAPRAGEILEHFNLLRSYDPEMFDVAVHMHKDPEVTKQQILKRGRSAGVSTFLDYDKSNAIGQLAFDTLAGESVDLGNGTMMKLRPREGWGGEKLDADLQAMGIDATSMTRHQKLLSLHNKKKTSGAGWTPYFKSPFTSGETAAIAASIPLGLGAAYAARRFLR